MAVISRLWRWKGLGEQSNTRVPPTVQCQETESSMQYLWHPNPTNWIRSNLTSSTLLVIRNFWIWLELSICKTSWDFSLRHQSTNHSLVFRSVFTIAALLFLRADRLQQCMSLLLVRCLQFLTLYESFSQDQGTNWLNLSYVINRLQLSGRRSGTRCARRRDVFQCYI